MEGGRRGSRRNLVAGAVLAAPRVAPLTTIRDLQAAYRETDIGARH
jgi:hypothetical protein